MLPAAGQQACGLASHSLVSVVTLANAGWEVHFTKIGCTITHRGKTILCGSKCMHTGLWMIPLTTSPALIPEQAAASVLPIAVAANIDATSTVAEHARFIHQALCSPLAATLLCTLATSSELVTIPGLIASSSKINSNGQRPHAATSTRRPIHTLQATGDPTSPKQS
jgi:hypothetical protein